MVQGEGVGGAEPFKSGRGNAKNRVKREIAVEQ
jgi:hypothetical protein